MSGFGRFNFAVKIDFERKCGSIEHCKTVLATGQMALDFASHLRREAAFQIFAE